MDESAQNTIAKAEQQLKEQIAKVNETKKLINLILEFEGDPPKYLDVDTATGAAPLHGDEYVNKRQSTASRLILELRKAARLGPATVDEIHSALIEGGYEFESKDAAGQKRSLYQMLIKSTSMFRRISNGKFGLLTWYGGVKKSKRSKADGKDDAGTSDGQQEPNGQASSDGDGDEGSDENGTDEGEGAGVN